MLHKKIKEEVAEAMKSKDKIRLDTIRGMVASITNELVSKKRKPTEELSDDEVLDVIRRGVKQRKDSIEQFKNGGRDDLAHTEEAEMKILETYLPETMSRDEIKIVVEEKAKEMNADKSKMGQLMGAVMKDLKGKALGEDVKAVIESMFE